MRSRCRTLSLVAVVVAALAAPQVADAAIAITRSELKAGQLRLEGQGAAPGATITVDGVARATADATGLFRIQLANFSSPTCVVTVGDGTGTVKATLAGCTPQAPPPPPPATAPGVPTFATKTLAGFVGRSLGYQAQGTNSLSDSLAFLYRFGDGTTLRDPFSGFYTVAPLSRVANGALVQHAFAAAGTYAVTVSAVDPSGVSTDSAPISVTVSPPPPAPDVPSFLLADTSGTAGVPLHYQAQAVNNASDSVAFRFSWGDGTTLRDPATGFYTVDPGTRTAFSATVSHAWSAAGTFPVTVTALDPAGATSSSAPVSVVVSPPPVLAGNDCGTGADAGASFLTAVAIALPATCAGSLDWTVGDSTDIYAFDVAQPFRLLSLTLTPPGIWSSVSPEVALIDPAGALHAGLAVKTVCADPQVVCATTATAPTAKVVGVTLPTAGTWKLVLGGDVATVGTSTYVKGSYSIALHAGGGGDDCVQGRNVIFPAPFDAPNNDFAVRLLDIGQTDCTGSLPFADLDAGDSYSFPVVLGEPVAAAVASTDVPGFAACSGRIVGTTPAGPLGRAGLFAPGCVGDVLRQAQATGDVFLDLAANWGSRTDTLGYRLRVATGSKHAGDCFTGADAGDSFATATAVAPGAACVGDVGVADASDWYTLAGVGAGDQISVARVPATLPVELYGPDGLVRGAPPLAADTPGTWRIRVTTDLAPLAHFEGAYGIQASVAPATTAPTDTVAITRAEYTAATQTLRVEATSTSATTTLAVADASTKQPIGTLTNLGGGKYGGAFTWPSYPQTVTVSSTGGGSATGPVALR